MVPFDALRVFVTEPGGQTRHVFALFAVLLYCPGEQALASVLRSANSDKRSAAGKRLIIPIALATSIYTTLSFCRFALLFVVRRCSPVVCSSLYDM